MRKIFFVTNSSANRREDHCSSTWSLQVARRRAAALVHVLCIHVYTSVVLSYVDTPCLHISSTIIILIPPADGLITFIVVDARKLDGDRHFSSFYSHQEWFENDLCGVNKHVIQSVGRQLVDKMQQVVRKRINWPKCKIFHRNPLLIPNGTLKNIYDIGRVRGKFPVRDQ